VHDHHVAGGAVGDGAGDAAERPAIPVMPRLPTTTVAEYTVAIVAGGSDNPVREKPGAGEYPGPRAE
jgi:hypothetical protein